MAIFNKRHVEIILSQMSESKNKSQSAHKCAQWLNSNFNLNVSGKQVYSKYMNTIHATKKPQKLEGGPLRINYPVHDKTFVKISDSVLDETIAFMIDADRVGDIFLDTRKNRIYVMVKH